MDAALTVALIAGAVALVSTVLNVTNTRAIERMKVDSDASKIAAEDKKQISIYSEALARAAFDLQSRLFNIARQSFIERFILNGSKRERDYAVENTTFLIAQFMCWVEMTRQEINFIQLEDINETRSLLRLQDDIYSAWGTDKWPSTFRLFAGEQRGLGEALIIGEPGYTTCIGYGAFLTDFPEHANDLVDYVRSQVDALSDRLWEATDRLVAIQHKLIDIIDLIDPEHVRFPDERRSKA